MHFECQKSEHSLIANQEQPQHKNNTMQSNSIKMNNQLCPSIDAAAACQVKAADHYNNIQTIAKPADEHHTRGRSSVKTQKLHHQRSASPSPPLHRDE